MKFTLKSLTLRYFKGVHNLKLDFKEGQNFIHGANEAFKTTVFDSVWWLFFGKDNTGRTDFNIKTLDRETGEVIEKVDHSVLAECDIDGLERSFERIYKETWKKSENKLKGHTTEFNIDDYPVPDPQKSNFDKAINELFSEETFKLLTNPLYLYSDKKMDMANRRRIVLGLAGPVDREQVISDMETEHPEQKKHIQELRDILKVQQDIAAIKLKITRDKKALNDAKLGIDDRIDENLRKIDAEPDWTVFEKQIEAKKKEIKDLDAQIFDVSNRAKDTNKKKLQLQDEIYMLQKRMNLLKNEATTKAEEANKGQGKDIEEARESIKQLTKKLEGFESEKKSIGERLTNGDKSIKDTKEEIQRFQVEIKEIEDKRKALKSEFEQEQKSAFQVTGECPTCGTDLETVEDYISKKEAEFGENKKQKLFYIRDKGLKYKKEIENIQGKIKDRDASIKKYETAINNLEQNHETSNTEIDELMDAISTLEAFVIESTHTKKEEKTYHDFLDAQYPALEKKVTEIEDQIKELQDSSTSQGLEVIQKQKDTIGAEIEALEKEYRKKDEIKSYKDRVEELKEEYRKLTNKITDIEGLENIVKEFNKSCMNSVEDEINSKFSLITWKMFEPQIGVDEDKEICEAIYKGVPFPDLNTAGKIQAGVDIINAFSNEHGVYLPGFIDNRESITEIPECKSQVINLVVDPSCKKLTLK